MSVDTNGQVPNLAPESGSALAVPEPEASYSGDEMHEHHHVPIVNNVVQEKQSPPMGYKQPPTTNGHDQMVVHHEIFLPHPDAQHSGLSEDEGSKRAVEKDGEERVVMSSKSGRFLKYDCEVGRGSFKTVYKGVDTETGVPVAWCELLENKYNKTEQARFKEEVSILKTLQHPNILRLYDYWEYVRQLDKKRILVLITELMTSGTLKGYMRRLKSIKPRLMRSWGRQILKGLHFLHTRTPPIIHRDLKCDNIFINGTTGLVKIGDLGLATLKRSEVSTVIGTPEFMAPEMYEESYDESVDVYAFGMCLLEMYTQEYPYMECSNPAQIYKKVTQGIRPVAMSKVKDPVLKEIIEKCVVPEKSKRFSVKQLLDHEFFSEGEMKVDLVKVEPIKDGTQLVFKMEGPQRLNKNGQDMVQFIYNMDEDKPDSVVSEMVNSGILRTEDKGHVSRSIREHVESVLVKRKVHQQGSKDSIGKENIPTSSTKEHSGSEDKEKERGKEAQRQNLAHVIVPAASTTISPVPPTSEAQSTEEQALTTPPVTIAPLSATNFPSKVQRQISGPESRELSEGHLAPALTSDEATESHSAPTVVTKTAAELVSGAPPLHPIATEVPVSEDPETQSKSGLRSAGMPKDTGVDASVKQRFKVEKVEPPVVEDSSIVRTLESGGSSASILSSLAAGDSQGDLGHEQPQGNGGTRKKSGRSKETKTKTLRLKHTYLSKDRVLGCSLNTSVGQVVNFKFSIEYDKPKEIFHNFVKAKHLMQSEEEEFICQVTKIIEMVKRGEIPTDAKSTGTEGKSLIPETQKPPASSQPPTAVDGLTVMSSSKVDPQESRQQAPREAATVQKQHPSPDLAGSRMHSVDKEAAPLVIPAASQDDALPGSRKKLVTGEEKITSVGSHLEDQSVTSQAEEKHPTVITQALPETATSPVHILIIEENIPAQHPSADISHKVPTSSSTLHVHHNLMATSTVQSKTVDAWTAATDTLVTTTGTTVMSTVAASHPLMVPSTVPTSSSSNTLETSKKFDIEDVVDSPAGSVHAGSPSEESCSETTQIDDNRSVNGGDWRSEEGHTGLESFSSSSVGHHGLANESCVLQSSVTIPDHSEASFVPHVFLPRGMGVFPASTGLYPPSSVSYYAPLGAYQTPTVSYQASTLSYQAPMYQAPAYQAPTGAYPTAADPHHHLGSSAAEFSQLMQGFLRFLQYMNWMMEDPAIKQLLHYSTPSSTMPDIGKQSSSQDQKGSSYSAEHTGDAGSDVDFDSQSDYESDPEYKKLIERYQEEAFKQAKAQALKDFRSGRTHRRMTASSTSAGPMQPVPTGPAPVGPENVHGHSSEHVEVLNHAHVRGPHPHDPTHLHCMVAGHSSSYSAPQYTSPPNVIPPPHSLPPSHARQPLPVAMQGQLHSGNRRDVTLEMDHTVSHGR